MSFVNSALSFYNCPFFVDRLVDSRVMISALGFLLEETGYFEAHAREMNKDLLEALDFE